MNNEHYDERIAYYQSILDALNKGNHIKLDADVLKKCKDYCKERIDIYITLREQVKDND